jgi:bifunctional oligoribonuclease and PAP phosphatase NrnA
VNLGDADFAPAAEALKGARTLWLTTHIKSDGDGIGCELALLRALRAMGKEARIVNDTPVPKPLRFLEEDPEEILIYDPARDDEFLKRADAIVVLDVGLTYRLGRLEPTFLASGATKICLDHHLDSDDAFTHVISDPGAGSTGEILFRLLKAAGATLDARVATPLFAAISVDTGSFSYERCTPSTFAAATELVAAGAEPYRIHMALNWQRSVEEMKLEGEVIGRLSLDDSGEVAYSEVTAEMLHRYHIDPLDLPAVVNLPLSLAGVELALLFVEVAPGSIKVSARSKGRVRANALAHRFGGGGHPLASGFCVQAPMEEALASVLHEARRLVAVSPALSDSA